MHCIHVSTVSTYKALHTCIDSVYISPFFALCLQKYNINTGWTVLTYQLRRFIQYLTYTVKTIRMAPYCIVAVLTYQIRRFIRYLTYTVKTIRTYTVKTIRMAPYCIVAVLTYQIRRFIRYLTYTVKTIRMAPYCIAYMYQLSSIIQHQHQYRRPCVNRLGGSSGI